MSRFTLYELKAMGSVRDTGASSAGVYGLGLRATDRGCMIDIFKRVIKVELAHSEVLKIMSVRMQVGSLISVRCQGL